MNELVSYLREQAQFHAESVARRDTAVVSHIATLLWWADEIERAGAVPVAADAADHVAHDRKLVQQPDERVATWQDAFNERHEFDVYDEHFMTGLRNEFCAGWHAALKQARATASQATVRGDAFRAAVEEMTTLLENGEWAEHVAETITCGDELASRLEAAITELHNDIGTVQETRAALAQSGATLTDERIDAIYDSVPWKDLNVNSLEHAKILRHRFARALLAARCDIGLRETGVEK